MIIFEEHSLTTPKEQNGYTDEIIIIDGTDLLLKYSLSNSIEDIKTAVYARTGCNVDLANASWKLNPVLSVSVKELMNKHCVIYSMTTWIKGKNKQLVVNMHLDDKWFITGFKEIKGSFYSWDFLMVARKFIKILLKYKGQD